MSRGSPTEKSPRKAGRPHGRVPRPHIPIEGDTLVPKAQAAEELGVATRTVTRMRPETVYFGGVAYIAIGKLRQKRPMWASDRQDVRGPILRFEEGARPVEPRHFVVD